ncbi:MAG TPA: NifB/NifX family molybdenum-iron cluster-binding protein [Candidatus Wallbacteria bacterium]|nr:MAG: Dinitrogenase iron-molybdenum cofactor [bacterium ADurb.Bin243]HOD40895.1 NifB/NifX family molybdenum-iron cluster-binding protein [Candidatus Wallbacteria bacterium]HPG56372.1 NifB/NifX family molybdenum-iron cluster-binding protein [Candidatus Wallbacteria bacterium]
MKIGFFSDDFKNISNHPGKSSGLYIFEIANGEILGEEIKVFDENDFSSASLASPAISGCGVSKGRGGQNGRGCFKFRNGFIRIDEKIKNLNVGASFYGCKTVVCRAIGFNLENKLAGAGIELLITCETDIKNAAKLYAAGKLENLHNREFL